MSSQSIKGFFVRNLLLRPKLQDEVIQATLGDGLWTAEAVVQETIFRVLLEYQGMFRVNSYQGFIL